MPRKKTEKMGKTEKMENTETVTIPAHLYGDIMRDWERLRRLEAHLESAVSGRDLLGEVERLKADRDGWARIAVEAQLPKMKRAALPSGEGQGPVMFVEPEALRGPRADPKKLTKPQIAMLRKMAHKGRQPTYGSDRARVQNNLHFAGLARFENDDGTAPKFFPCTGWCAITEAGRQVLQRSMESPSPRPTKGAKK